MPYSNTSPTSLKSYFIKSQMVLSIITLFVCVFGLTAIATHTFKKYSEYNLQLIAQSLSEQLQAAVVFEDTQTIKEILNSFIYKYPIESIQVFSPEGGLLSETVNPAQASHSRLMQQIQKWLISEHAGDNNVIHNGQTIAKVRVVNSINPLIGFVNLFLLVFLGCIFFAFIIGWISTRIIYHRINRSLDLLTDTTELISEKRAFQLRVPKGRIAEFNKISHRFNELLDEIQTWHTHLQQENSHLEHRALHDALTQLPNRAYFNQRLELLFEDEDSRPHFALLFIDNNNFKEINDTYGHQVGDAVLQEMANRLKQALRHNDFLARLGGDEFAVLLIDIKHASHALTVAQNLLLTAHEPLMMNNQIIHFSFSIGIAMSADANSAEQLVYFADQAMYQAKENPIHWASYLPSKK